MRQLIAAIAWVGTLATMHAAPAWAGECEQAMQDVVAARKAGDLEAARAASDRARFCNADVRVWVDSATAKTCFERLLAAPPADDAAIEKQLGQCRSLGPDWRIHRELADLAYQGSRFDEAAQQYDQALSIIHDTRLVPAVPDEGTVLALVQRGDESRILAKQFQPSTRSASGELTGLGALSVRGIGVRKRALPITFEYNSTEFTERGADAAEELRLALSKSCEGAVQLIGHTDERGSDAYNLDLSRRRAEALAAYIRKVPLPAACVLTTEGRGESDPPVLDDPARYSQEQRWMLARRVELVR